MTSCSTFRTLSVAKVPLHLLKLEISLHLKNSLTTSTNTQTVVVRSSQQAVYIQHRFQIQQVGASTIGISLVSSKTIYMSNHTHRTGQMMVAMTDLLSDKIIGIITVHWLEQRGIQ